MNRTSSLSMRDAVALPIVGAALAAALSAQAPRDPGWVLATLPARIVPNAGQWSSPELYRMNVGGLQLFLEPQGWSFWLRETVTSVAPGGTRPSRLQPTPRRAVAVRMTFVDAGEPVLAPERRLGGVSSYLVGSDASHRARVEGYASVRYDSVYPGVDVRVRDGAGQFEYDVLLEPGADLARVRIRVDGATSMSIDAAGALVVDTELGEVRQPRPTTWMVTPSGERPVVCDYELSGDGCFGFVAPGRDPALPLVVDPFLTWGSYIGGSALDVPMDVIEHDGHVIVCGFTDSIDYPSSVGSIQTSAGGGARDGFVIRLDPSQPAASQVVFSTYFGGVRQDAVLGVAVLSTGQIAFAGETQSSGLPVTPGAAQGTFGGGLWDGFVGLMDAGGSQLLGLSYHGGEADDSVTSVHVGPGDDLFIVGLTASTQLPLAGLPYQRTNRGGRVNGYDGFVARLDGAVTNLIYSSYLGGTRDEWLQGGHVDAAGVLTIMGATLSTNFPTTTNAFDRSHDGGTNWWSAEAVVVRFDPSQPATQQLVYSTYFGGIGDERPFDVTISPSGEIVLCGTATSRDLPTTPDSYQPRNAGGFNQNDWLGGDAFIATFDPTASGTATLTTCTYFGGRETDQGRGCIVDPSGEITLVGWSNGTNNDLPTTPKARRRSYKRNDGYVARFSGDLRQLLYASLHGGSDDDGIWHVTQRVPGNPTVAGSTLSDNFPRRNAAQTTYGGGEDGFVSHVHVVATGTTRHGAPTAGARGHPTIHAIDDATLGNAKFGFACSQAPTFGQGVWILSLRGTTAVRLLGIDLFVDLNRLAIMLPVTADAAGEHVLPLPLPPDPLGQFHAQYVWVEDPALLTLSASDAMRVN